jgi:hypothetical protein
MLVHGSDSAVVLLGSKQVQGKKKKVRPVTGHEDPEGEVEV